MGTKVPNTSQFESRSTWDERWESGRSPLRMFTEAPALRDLDVDVSLASALSLSYAGLDGLDLHDLDAGPDSKALVLKIQSQCGLTFSSLALWSLHSPQLVTTLFVNLRRLSLRGSKEPVSFERDIQPLRALETLELYRLNMDLLFNPNASLPPLTSLLLRDVASPNGFMLDEKVFGSLLSAMGTIVDFEMVYEEVGRTIPRVRLFDSEETYYLSNKTSHLMDRMTVRPTTKKDVPHVLPNLQSITLYPITNIGPLYSVLAMLKSRCKPNREGGMVGPLQSVTVACAGSYGGRMREELEGLRGHGLEVILLFDEGA